MRVCSTQKVCHTWFWLWCVPEAEPQHKVYSPLRLNNTRKRCIMFDHFTEVAFSQKAAETNDLRSGLVLLHTENSCWNSARVLPAKRCQEQRQHLKHVYREEKAMSGESQRTSMLVPILVVLVLWFCPFWACKLSRTGNLHPCVCTSALIRASNEIYLHFVCCGAFWPYIRPR